MPVIVESLIVWLSVTLGIPCHDAFFRVSSDMVAKDEHAMLREFAVHSCRTQNPDILWQIAMAESSLRFRIARINRSADSFRIATGKESLDLGPDVPKGNVDIGVLQINAGVHGKFFKSLHDMMSPARQVQYVVDNMSESLVARCGRYWVGCYHSWSNRERARSYQEKVARAGVHLRRLVSKTASETRSVTPEKIIEGPSLTVLLDRENPAYGTSSGDCRAKNYCHLNEKLKGARP